MRIPYDAVWRGADIVPPHHRSGAHCHGAVEGEAHGSACVISGGDCCRHGTAAVIAASASEQREQRRQGDCYGHSMHSTYGSLPFSHCHIAFLEPFDRLTCSSRLRRSSRYGPLSYLMAGTPRVLANLPWLRAEKAFEEKSQQFTLGPLSNIDGATPDGLGGPVG